VLARAEGRPDEALVRGEEAFNRFIQHGFLLLASNGLAEAGQAALALGTLDKLEALLERCAALQPVSRTHSLQGQEARLTALLAARRGDVAEVEPRFRTAVARFREIGVPFGLAVSLLEHGEWLAAQGRAAEADPLLGEARTIFDTLAARPWLKRLAQVGDAVPA
jgi:tetratricopeptide (TPR) repeat protein